MATTTLTLAPGSHLAEIVATVEGVSGATSVSVIYPAVDLLVTPNEAAISSGETVTYTYQLTNTGDTPLTSVTVVDDHGTPGNDSDDLTVCEVPVLTAGEEASCSRSTMLDQTTTITAVATGQDPMGRAVTDSDSAIVIVDGRVYLPIVVKSGGM